MAGPQQPANRAGQEAALGRCDQRHQGSKGQHLHRRVLELPKKVSSQQLQLLKQLGEFLENSKILSHSIHGIHGIFSYCTFTTKLCKHHVEQLRKSGCLGYIEDYTTQLCGDYYKPDKP